MARPVSMPWGAAALASALAVVMALLAGGGAPVRQALLLDTGLVRDGAVWRMAGAQLVNLSAVHTGLNVLGLGLILVTLGPVLDARRLAVAVAASAAAVGLGWVALMPPGISYVGFSAITHGVMAFGGLLLLKAGPRWFGWLVLACLAAKLGHEATQGAVPGADAAIGGRVSFVSHALGTLGGALAARGTPRVPRWTAVALCGALALWHAEVERAAVGAPPILPASAPRG